MLPDTAAVKVTAAHLSRRPLLYVRQSSLNSRAPARLPKCMVPDLTRADIERVLSRVCDPCSLAAGSPLPITALGLVTGWSANSGTLRVSITATGPGCTFLGKIADAARAELLSLHGVHDVRIELDTETVWHPGRMSPAARESLGRRRAAAAAGVVPYARRTEA
jgi:metal-sulfur cluster biosynthetic enzyme